MLAWLPSNRLATSRLQRVHRAWKRRMDRCSASPCMMGGPVEGPADIAGSARQRISNANDYLRLRLPFRPEVQLPLKVLTPTNTLTSNPSELALVRTGIPSLQTSVVRAVFATRIQELNEAEFLHGEFLRHGSGLSEAVVLDGPGAAAL